MQSNKNIAIELNHGLLTLIESNQTSYVESLLKNALPGTYDLKKMPFHQHIYANNSDMISVLIQYGADVRTFDGILADAVKGANIDSVLTLLQSNTPTTWIDPKNGDGLVHLAVNNAVEHYNKYLSNRYLDERCSDSEYKKYGNSLKIIQLLVQYGADITHVNHKGKTPIQLGNDETKYIISNAIIDRQRNFHEIVFYLCCLYQKDCMIHQLPREIIGIILNFAFPEQQKHIPELIAKHQVSSLKIFYSQYQKFSFFKKSRASNHLTEDTLKIIDNKSDNNQTKIQKFNKRLDEFKKNKSDQKSYAMKLLNKFKLSPVINLSHENKEATIKNTLQKP